MKKTGLSSSPETIPAENPDPLADPRSKAWRIGSFLVQLSILIGLLYGMQKWQTRGLLSEGSPAPDFNLTDLQGGAHQLADGSGRKTVLYFFAPWCTICKVSFPTLARLRAQRSPEEIRVFAVALSYDTVQSVAAFAGSEAEKLPVLLGIDSTGQDYRIGAFPTVYLIDDRGKVAARSMGLATTAMLTLEGF